MKNLIGKETLIKFEEEIKSIYETGVIMGPIHLSGGNEEALIKIFEQVKPEDWVLSTHRSHFHALLKGVPVELVKAEILAGNSIHLNFKDYNFLSSAIIGGICPIAVGLAMGIKRKGENRRVYCFIGDMAAETGIFHECAKYAHFHSLDITWVVEDNGLSVNTPTREVWNMPEGEAGEFTPTYIRYRFERKFPHIGTGKWVIFP